jgi:hypothetical protein
MRLARATAVRRVSCGVGSVRRGFVAGGVLVACGAPVTSEVETSAGVVREEEVVAPASEVMGPVSEAMGLEDPVVAWFVGHPEVVSVAGGEVEASGFHHLWLGTTVGSIQCFRGGEPARGWCWEDGRVALRVRVLEGRFERRKDGALMVELAVAAWAGDGGEVQGLRFPAGERAVFGPIAAEARSTRPGWFPRERARVTRPKRPAKATWGPIAAVPAIDAGPLDGLEIEPVPSTSPGVTAVRIVEPGRPEREDATARVCVRWQGRWACGESGDLDEEAVSDALDSVLAIPASSGGAWVVAQRSRLEDGGSGEDSGAGADVVLELYRVDGARLATVGSLQVGGMEWSMGRWRRALTRFTTRWYHEHASGGVDCLRLLPASEEHAMTDAEFVTERQMDGLDRAFTRVAVPDVLVAAEGVFALPPGPVPLSDDDAGDEVGPQVRWELAGVWRIEDAGRLVRTSRDPAATCAAGSGG